MQKKYTENIDQLENFYVDSLQNASIEPPAEIWDRVSASYQKELGKNNFFKTYRLSILLLLLISFSVITYAIIQYNSTDNTESSISPNQPPVDSEKTLPINNESKENKEVTNAKENKAKDKNKILKSNTTDNTVTDNNAIVEDPSNTLSNTTVNITKPADTIATTTPVATPEKKKIKFKDKHKEQYQDSTRELFVPKK